MTAQILPLRRTTDEWAKAIAAAWQKSTASILETGHLLIKAKGDLGHGEWLVMVETRLPFKKSTAQRLMQIARHPVLSNAAHVRLLPPSWGTLVALTKVPNLEARIADGSINPKMERKDVTALRGKTPTRASRKGRAPKQDVADDERPPRTSVETTLEAFGLFDGCVMLVQRVVGDVLDDLPPDQRPRLLAKLRAVLDHWEKWST